MNIKSIRTILFSCAFVSLLSACNSDDEGGSVVDQTMAQCLTCSTDETTKAQSFNKISFATQYNYSNNTVDVTIYNIVLPVAGSPDGTLLPKMEFKSLPWKFNSQGWKVVDVENVKPMIGGMTDATLFDEFYFCIADVFDSTGKYTPGILYSFEINSRYDVEGCCMTGTTKSTSPDGVAYIPENDSQTRIKPTYLVDFDFEKSTADIYIFAAKFLGNMPSLNLEFPDVPYKIENGKVVLEAANLTPEYNGMPFPSFPISKLKATIDYSKGMTLDFHCGYRGSDYTVNIECKY